MRSSNRTISCLESWRMVQANQEYAMNSPDRSEEELTVLLGVSSMLSDVE
jgi:hypothetical protein